ncbi:hypothetical protein [Streptomyces goshikiensis]|uniref:hypothetical protein n=1 Tax=Streptomyces goshikiensis TaxID=1942 RepID=UPI00364A2AB9
MKRTSTKLADGRELVYYDLDLDAAADREALDRRPLEPVESVSELRLDRASGIDYFVSDEGLDAQARTVLGDAVGQLILAAPRTA